MNFDPKTGLLEGDYLKHLAGIGIQNLAAKVNRGLMGSERPFMEADLPPKVRALVDRAGQLEAQFERCGAVEVTMAGDYLKATARLASEALPLVVAELQQREHAAAAAVAAVRASLMGKATGPLMEAVVSQLMEKTGAVAIAEREAQVASWRTAMAICRDVSVNKTAPRWLTVMVAAHEMAKATG